MIMTVLAWTSVLNGLLLRTDFRNASVRISSRPME